MKLILLGTGSFIPSKKRNSSGYYISTEQENFLIDSGPGVFHALAQAGIDYSLLDGVFYSHEHIDHIADFLPLMNALTNDPLLNRKKDFTIYASAGVISYFKKLEAIFGEWIKPTQFCVMYHELKDFQTITTAHFEVQARKMKHTDHSLGFSFIHDTKKIVYSGDTDYCDALIELSTNADITIYECSCPEEYYELHNITTHLTATLAAQMAQKASVKKLILTHFYPATENFPLVERAQKYFQGQIILGEDFMAFEL